MSSTPREVTAVEVRRHGATATAVPERHGWEVSLHLPDALDDREATGAALLGEIVTEVGRAGGGPVAWRVLDATPDQRRIADAAGFDGTRRIVRMRRSLPLPWSATIATRAFRPGHDELDWLRVNNAAFHWHPEQGGWNLDDLHRRLAEPWFDPEGFRLHPVDGPLDGFCWTKVHREVDPPVGEIFVIGVHPDAAGRGLGRQLVLAGLDHLSALGLTEVKLYTESDNAPARALYDRLGFTVTHTVTVFRRMASDAEQ